MSAARNDAPIGIFDSGMGGLTVMRALMAQLPRECFIYLGDTARLPYGTKSGETVSRYAVQAAGALMRRRVKLIVVACNTASAVALPALEAAFAPVPVIGVVEPGAAAAISAAPRGPIAILATESTVRGGAYVRAIQALNRDAEIVQQACPLFVPLAEDGLIDGPIAELVAERYLAPLFAQDAARPQCVVLGCTHFPVLERVIARVVGQHVPLVDSAVTTAQAVAHLLAEKNLARGGTAPAPPLFLATDAPERFARVGRIFLGREIPADKVEFVDLQAG
jgi:glutamate racemase